jgi:hypothetical protein
VVTEVKISVLKVENLSAKTDQKQTPQLKAVNKVNKQKFDQGKL